MDTVNLNRWQEKTHHTLRRSENSKEHKKRKAKQEEEDTKTKLKKWWKRKVTYTFKDTSSDYEEKLDEKEARNTKKMRKSAILSISYPDKGPFI